MAGGSRGLSALHDNDFKEVSTCFLVRNLCIDCCNREDLGQLVCKHTGCQVRLHMKCMRQLKVSTLLVKHFLHHASYSM